MLAFHILESQYIVEHFKRCGTMFLILARFFLFANSFHRYEGGITKGAETSKKIVLYLYLLFCFRLYQESKAQLKGFFR